MLEQQTELEACSLSPIYFLNQYGKILDANQGILPFKLWNHQTEALNDFLEYRKIICLKSRQVGWTWLLAGYDLWKALFTEGANIILLSKNEQAASEKLGYITFIHSQLPDFLRPRKGSDQTTLVSFPSVNSKIRALAAVASAGVGFGQATLIDADEWDLWDDQDAVRRNYAEIKPMIDMAGQHIIGSAINKYEQETKFKELLIKALAGEGGYHPMFIAYDVIPGRDEKWYEQQKQEYDQWEIEGRYPKTIQEALAAPGLVALFDTKALEDMRAGCQSPIAIERNGLVKIYSNYIPGHRYCLVVDPAEGVDDPSVGKIICDGINAEVAAEFSGRIPITEQSLIFYELYERYQKPFTVVERNAIGLSLIDKMIALGISNWFYHDKQKTKHGWWTGVNRPPMIAELSDVVYQRHVREMNPNAIEEFRNFIRTKKHPEGEARGGAHDDHVMCWAMFFQARKNMTHGTGEFTTFKYKVTDGK